MPSRWLVAYDFSRSADAALDLAIDELGERGGELILVHAYAVPDVPASMPWSEADAPLPSTNDLERTLTFEVAKAVERVAENARARAPSIEVETLLVRGPPAESIVDAAKHRRVERIIVGTHGRTGLSHLLLGSVAERVLRLADVPVLVVKTPEAAETRGD